MQDTSHDKLHRALTDIGPDLPEPRAPEHVRRAVESMSCASLPAVHTGWLRAGTWLVGIAACVLGLLSLVLFVQNERLHQQLLAARTSDPAIRPAVQTSPPLMMVNFVHEQCQVAKAMAPRIQEIAARHSGQPVLFVTLDVTERCESQTKLLAQSLGLETVFSECNVSARSGTVALIDTRSHEVVATCSGVEKLDEFEQVLNTKVASCTAECPPK